MGVKLGVSLTEECRLRIYENRVLTRIFGHEREKVTGEWRKLHNEELNVLQMIKSRRLSWAGHVAHMGDRRGS